MQKLRGFSDRLCAGYAHLFSIHEIRDSKTLQWVFGATVLSYYGAFFSWIFRSGTSVEGVADGSNICWHYFQSCQNYLFLHSLPYGYSQTLLYMTLFGVFFLVIYRMYRVQWVAAHALLLPAFLWHLLGTFVITNTLAGNYDYYLFSFAFILLFLPHKEFFLKLALVLFYFLSTAVKIHPTWVLGTYFSSLLTGLPLFTDVAIPFWTNFLIFMEMVAAWFLLGKPGFAQKAVFAFFVIFHLYSGLLVGYRYPTTVLPTLVILFGPFYRYTVPPLDRRSIAGWIFVCALLAWQSIPHIIPGDEKLTLEGNRAGVYMFEANHQCISRLLVSYADGSSRDIIQESARAPQRCDPYDFWFGIQRVCQTTDSALKSVHWTFDHSVNGEPFLRIVYEPDACALSYKPFSRNPWIRSEKDNPPVVGYPVENLY